MPSAIHESAIRRICERFANVETIGFMKAVNRVVTAEGADPCRWPVIPDAYSIVQDGKMFVAFEVEDRSRITTEKMRRYCDMAWALDDHYWELTLIIVNRWGEVIGTVFPLQHDLEEIVRRGRSSYKPRNPGWGEGAEAVRGIASPANSV